MSDVTRLLRAVERGDKKASEELLPLVYEELRRLAKSKLTGERAGQTLQATDLVHEAFDRLVGAEGVDDPKWNGVGHFFGAAAEAMRRILIDRARAKATAKRGGDHQRVELEGFEHPAEKRPERLLQLEEALIEFEKVDPEKAQIVKLRFFAGLTGRQTAEALGVSTATVDRHWAFARAWLKAEMEETD